MLEKLIRSRTAPHRDVQRALALLMAVDGFANTRIASEVGVSPVTVKAWRERFAEDGLKDFSGVRPGRGRKPSIPAGEGRGDRARDVARDARRVRRTGAVGRWPRRRGVARRRCSGSGPRAGLQPHRVETFKLSNDPRFEEKLVDVVGLYLNPPENAIVLCMDEKSQIQALDRTQPSLPIKPGRAGTMTHDYKRNGTTTLFAALDVLTGSVIGQCLPRHRHIEFLKFLRTIDREVPKGLRDPPDPRQLRHPQPPQRQGVAGQAPTLRAALHPDLELVAEHGRALLRQAHRQSDPPRHLPQRPRPDRRDRGLPRRPQREPRAVPWTATADQILEKVRRGRVTLDAITNP